MTSSIRHWRTGIAIPTADVILNSVYTHTHILPVLKRDLNTIREWAQKLKMEFKVDKWKIMHIGGTNPKQSYNMGGINLTVTTEEKDLGVLVDDELEFDKHIRAIVNKANRMLGMIRRGFTCLNK